MGDPSSARQRAYPSSVNLLTFFGQFRHRFAQLVNGPAVFGHFVNGLVYLSTGLTSADKQYGRSFLNASTGLPSSVNLLTFFGQFRRLAFCRASVWACVYGDDGINFIACDRIGFRSLKIFSRRFAFLAALALLPAPRPSLFGQREAAPDRTRVLREEPLTGAGVCPEKKRLTRSNPKSQ